MPAFTVSAATGGGHADAGGNPHAASATTQAMAPAAADHGDVAVWLAAAALVLSVVALGLILQRRRGIGA